MPTPQDLVASASTWFFDTVLPEATGKRFAALPDPRVHLGAYERYAGPALPTTLGESITPGFILRVSPTLPVAAGRPDPAGAAVAAGGPTRPILWTRHLADAAVDDVAEIARVMADLDSFADPFGTAKAAAAPAGATPAATTSAGAIAARSDEWSRAIVASRAALGVDLAALMAVPAPLQDIAEDLDGLKQILAHFCTYDDGGHYYPRWAGAGRDPANPAHLSPAYRRNNLVEVKLARDHVYLYAVVPEGLFSGRGDLDASIFREVVVRFTETGLAERPFTLATVHTARRRQNAAAHCDFVVFFAEEGLGIPAPRAVREKLSARLTGLVGDLTSASEKQAEVATAADFVIPTDDGVMVQLVASIDGDIALPAGVIAEPGGSVRTVLAPPERILELAALPGVKRLDLMPPGAPSLDQARTMVKHSDLMAKVAAGKRGGKGVVVGIIDTGIDGSHPAFAGRLLAVWDQGNPTLAPGQTPKQNNPGKPAYALFNWGVELTGADVTKARDTNGHGTHVASTAAGAPVSDAAGAVQVPAGLAPEATIVAVRAISSAAPGLPDRSNWLLGAQYIFAKAAELGLPCVINMSFGHHHHAHDGSDDASMALFRILADASGNYRPGRIVVAAAGNDGENNTHLRREVPANSTRTVATIQLRPPPNLPPPVPGLPPVLGLLEESVNIWVRNPAGATAGSFPLDVYTYRQTHRRNTYHDVTAAVRVGKEATAAKPAGTFAQYRTRVEVRSEAFNKVNGDHHFQLVYRAAPATAPMPIIPNQWAIVLVNGSPSPLDVHLWIADTPHTASVFMEATTDQDHACLVGSPAASAAAISVACAASRLSWPTPAGTRTALGQPRVGELTTFSSPGDLRTGSIAPATFCGVTHEVNAIDVAAPGCFIQAALSAQATPGPGMQVNALSQMMSGTSMASPVVTGLVADLLAEDPGLTLPQVLARLKAASSIPADSEYQPPKAPPGTKPLSPNWGYGLVDAGKLKP